MYKTELEIFSQYDALEKTFSRLIDMKDIIKTTALDPKLEGITFIGCGSSYSLCKSAAASARIYLKKKTQAIAAGDLLVNFEHYSEVIRNTLLVAPSRSGSTSEVLLAVERARTEAGVKCISVCARENSELAGFSELSIELPWAFDESVCQTRTVTNLYLANLMMIGVMAGNESLIEELKSVVNTGKSLMESCKEPLKKLAEAFPWKKVIVLADSELEGIAEEGALAFNEICHYPSNYYHVLDVRHGPMVLVNPSTLAIVMCSPLETDYQHELVNDLKKRGAFVITVSSKMKETWGSDHNIHIPEYKHFGVSGIPFIFVPQMLSLYRALADGVNPDEPQGLDPWIKL